MHSPRILFIALALFGLPKLGLAGAYDEDDSLQLMSERDDFSGADILELAARDRVRVKHGYGSRARPGKLSKRAGEQCYPVNDIRKTEECKDCDRDACRLNPLTGRCVWARANRGVGCRGCKCKKYGE